MEFTSPATFGPADKCNIVFNVANRALDVRCCPRLTSACSIGRMQVHNSKLTGLTAVITIPPTIEVKTAAIDQKNPMKVH